MAASLGLTPRQNSSGGKERLLGITKRGDAQLRTLLIHGARSVLRTAASKNDRMSRWVTHIARRGTTTSRRSRWPTRRRVSPGR
jgi:transposase